MVKGEQSQTGRKKQFQDRKKPKQTSDRVKADTKGTSQDFSSFQTDIQIFVLKPPTAFQTCDIMQLNIQPDYSFHCYCSDKVGRVKYRGQRRPRENLT